MIYRYTKAVLTVIAVCFCLITAQNFNIVPSAEASGHIQKVALCDIVYGTCADGNLWISIADKQKKETNG